MSSDTKYRKGQEVAELDFNLLNLEALQRIATALEKLTDENSPLLGEVRALGKSVVRLSDNISRLTDGVARGVARM